MTIHPTRQLDTSDLETRVKAMYEEVALAPHREFHFETGRGLATRLGYPPADLDTIPTEAIDSFAGAGYSPILPRSPRRMRCSTSAADQEPTASWPRSPPAPRDR
jgi:hypothetical protein